MVTVITLPQVLDLVLGLTARLDLEVGTLSLPVLTASPEDVLHAPLACDAVMLTLTAAAKYPRD